jgi:hypothetical protein
VTKALDRAQRRYAAGRRAAEALGDGPVGPELGHGLVRRVEPGDRAYLLAAEPWAVFLDRP